MLGFLFRVGPVPTFLLKLFLFPRMGIALLPVAAGSSSLLEATQGRTVLPKGILTVARAAKQLLEAVEDCIFKKKFGGGFGLVWFL